MSDFVEWIAAQSEADGRTKNTPGISSWPTGGRHAKSTFPQNSDQWQQLPAHNFRTHNFPAGMGREGARSHEDAIDRNPDLWLYRSRTVALLRRYLRLSLETGRLPSMGGKEFFRSKVTAYRSVTFEDRVIFVSDVEKILNRLEYWDQQLIERIILQEHSHEKAAYLLHCCRKTIERRVPEVLDLLSEDFLEVGLLVALPSQGGRRR